MRKGSENAKAVAKEVMETVRKGKKVNAYRIQRRHGYSHSSAKAMKGKRTKTYQKEIKPLIKQLEDERQAILTRLPKVRSKAKYRDLIDGLDKTTKNIQLLGGRPTEISVFTDELKNKLDSILE